MAFDHQLRDNAENNRQYIQYILIYRQRYQQIIMSNPMQKSMQGTSQFVSFQASMQQSMVGSSQKIPISNASSVNRAEQQRDMKAYKQINKSMKKATSIKQAEDEEQNQFLHVNKWNKQQLSNIRKAYEQDQPKNKQVTDCQKQQSAKEQPVYNTSSASSKWEKKKSNDSSNKSQQPIQKSVQPPQQQKKKNDYVKEKNLSQLREPQEMLLQNSANQLEQQNQEYQEEQEVQEDQGQQQDQQQQQQQVQQQQEQEQQQDQDQQQDQEEQDEQQEEQQQQQIEDHSGVHNQQFQQSSEAVKTQTINTSAVGNTPKPGKWGKKKAPLETMTKYDNKQQANKTTEKDEKYHSKLNSEVYDNKDEYEEVIEDLDTENTEEWAKIEKVLLRMKLLLS